MERLLKHPAFHEADEEFFKTIRRLERELSKSKINIAFSAGPTQGPNGKREFVIRIWVVE